MRRTVGPLAFGAAVLLALATAASAQPAVPAAPAATEPQQQPQPKTPLPPRDTPRAPEPGKKAAAQDPDWPCLQRKVPSMSYGQMWGGPPLEDAAKAWRNDKAVADLVPTIVARRTSMDEARAAIEDFAKAAGAEKNQKLSRLFAGAFEELNDQRGRIIAGIERYARKQRALADRIKEESQRIAASQKDMAAQMSPEGQKDQQTLDWDTRIYDERVQSLTYVCETPVILEQRAFDLGREIQNHLD
ncbi:hypothetical protein [Hansschlegelia sp.]|uniref:hypothetical protein n=1 Tax=Hansschlegelia sp. TaxID=2041892 RepID=UPI002C104E6C|nr:hypothetical protein [Hansschlegelia sp.]HVI29196.1 hypothetical protein [Hansschlegelia sp.]